MKLVVQRVSEAEVRIKDTGNVVGKIGKGLFVLVGIKKGDTEKNADILAEKLLKLRVMSDENDKMNLSIKDVQAELLVVSQFTLYADTSGGNRPSFVGAALPDEARPVYEHFVKKLNASLPADRPVETGQFGAYMEISPQLDGPVTIVLEF